MLLVIIGGLNWGLVALFEFDLVAALTGNDFGETNIASRLIYGLVGLSALFMIYFVSRFLPRRMLIVESE
jgi:hypothetical protein